MRSNTGFGRYVLLSVALSLLGACTSQKEPAQKLIGDVESTIDASAAQAAQYVPDQLTDAQKKLGELKSSYDKGDYKAVIDGAPAAMSAAQALAGEAASKKDKMMQTLNDQWTSLAAALPGNANAIQSRIDFLSKPANRKLASGVDLNEAKMSLSDATSLWSKAQAAFAAGNVEEAVTAGNGAKAKFDALAASMKLDLQQPAAIQDTSPGV